VELVEIKVDLAVDHHIIHHHQVLINPDMLLVLLVELQILDQGHL
jgi:hypothetical protein